jgi:predicted phage terminase large subunit-like protein
MLIIGANQQEASAKLRLIVDELEGNDWLRAAAPGQLDPALDAKNQRVAYGDREVVLGSGVRIAAAGLGAKVRGQLHDGRRLDLIVLDDPEDDYTVASAARRRAARAWVERALINALDARCGSLIWLGTLLHHDAVLARWLEDKDGLDNWRVLNMAAINEDGAPLWPGRWTIGGLKAREREIGKAAFAQEFLNRPVSADQQVFKGEDFKRYNGDDLAVGPAGCFIGSRELAVAAGVDPAIGQDDRHDWFAAAVVGVAEGGEIYVLEVTRGRFRFSQQLDLLTGLWHRWRPRLIGIESVAYQASLAHAVIDRGLPVRQITGARSKLARIEAAAVHAARGKLYLPLDSAWGRDFVREALEFPAGEHDDQLDALAYAVETALPLAGGGGLIHAVERRDRASRGFC